MLRMARHKEMSHLQILEIKETYGSDALQEFKLVDDYQDYTGDGSDGSYLINYVVDYKGLVPPLKGFPEGPERGFISMPIAEVREFYPHLLL